MATPILDGVRRSALQDLNGNFATVTGGKLDVNATVTTTASTEYTEGETDATLTGGVVMWEDAADTVVAASAGKPLPVNVVAGGTAGTQYTEGDTDATITGTALMWEDAADTLVAASAAKPLPTDGQDRALRDNGKVDVASVDQYTPIDTDSGAGTENSLPVAIRFPANGGGGTCPGDSTNGMKVQVATALPAGTNAIGKLAANSGVDIGDVDITSIAAGDNNIGNVDIVTLPSLVAGSALIGKVSIDQVTANANEVVVKSAIPAGTNNIGDVDVLTVPAPLSTTGSGTEATALRVTIATDSTGVLSIDDNGGALTVDNGGTFAVQATSVGTVADDATTPGAPVMVGGQAKETDGTDPGSVSAEDDVARCITDRNRRLLVNTRHPNAWVAYQDETTAQTSHEVKAAPGAGLSLYVTDIAVSNGATAGYVFFLEDTGGGATQLTGKLYLAINGGCVMNLQTPIRVTANKNFGFTSNTVTTHTVTVWGYTAP